MVTHPGFPAWQTPVRQGTWTVRILSPLPLPIGLVGRCTERETRTLKILILSQARMPIPPSPHMDALVGIPVRLKLVRQGTHFTRVKFLCDTITLQGNKIVLHAGVPAWLTPVRQGTRLPR